MADTLTFMMGNYPADLPGDRLYASNHMWCQPTENQSLRCGFTAYAIRLMQDVYFLDWEVSPHTAVQLKQTIGHIETSKAQSDLFPPTVGTLIRFNETLEKNPETINVEPYGAGWLFEMEAATDRLMNVAEYHDYLTANWDKTQNLLKGHM